MKVRAHRLGYRNEYSRNTDDGTQKSCFECQAKFQSHARWFLLARTVICTFARIVIKNRD